MPSIATNVEAEQFVSKTTEALDALKTATKENAEKINAFLDAQDAKAQAEADAKTKEAERLEAMEQKQADLETALADPTGGDAPEGEHADAAYTKAHREYLKNKGVAGLEDIHQKALTRSETANGNAGFLVPPEYVPELVALRADISPLRQHARVVNTERELQKIPIQTAAHTAVWVAEGAARSETTGTAFSEIEIRPQVLRAEIRATEETIEDSFFDVDGILYTQFIEQFARAEGIGFIRGSGSGQPRGILTTGDANTLVATGATAKTTAGAGQYDVTFAVINTVVHNLKSSYARNAQFCFNRDTLGRIRAIESDNGSLIYQPGTVGTTGAPSTIMGHRWFEAADMQSFGTASQTPIIFGDFRTGYRIVDRTGIRVKVDEYTAEANGQIKYIARTRVGGSVVDKEALRVVKTS